MTSPYATLRFTCKSKRDATELAAKIGSRVVRAGFLRWTVAVTFADQAEFEAFRADVGTAWTVQA